MFQDISIDEFLKLMQSEKLTLIDVRSPSEYGDGTIPGSLNIPLFDDAERAEVGTLYTQTGAQAAKEKGLHLVSAKLPAFVEAFQRVSGDKVVYCWRGGMRSKAAATLLSLMGIHVYRLIGGIRDYRKWVVETLRHYDLPAAAIVLNGNTGTGKTAILQELKNQGHPVLDLEALAGHRGSVFGGVGLRAHNQKQFDYLLLHELLHLPDRPYVLFEAESKRIGKIVLPEFLISKKEQGIQFHIEMPVGERVRNILEEYEPWKHQSEILPAFRQIMERIHTPVAKEIERCLQTESYEEAVELLLAHYYDPRYTHSIEQFNGETIRLQVRNKDEALRAIAAYVQQAFADRRLPAPE